MRARASRVYTCMRVYNIRAFDRACLNNRRQVRTRYRMQLRFFSLLGVYARSSESLKEKHMRRKKSINVLSRLSPRATRITREEQSRREKKKKKKKKENVTREERSATRCSNAIKIERFECWKIYLKVFGGGV